VTTERYTEGQYVSNNPSWHVEDSAWKAKQILCMLDKNGVHPRTVCEVGCGAGEVLAQIHASLSPRCDFTGYDISPDALALAKTRERSGLRFELKDVKEVGEQFEVLLLIDVIEHVEDYLGFLRSLRSRSRYTILHIPLDLSAQTVLRAGRLLRERDAVGHLHYFTKETALRTVADAGYVVRDYFFTAGTIDLPVKSLKARLARYPRKLLYQLSADWAARVLGGFSLMVLAESSPR